MTERKAGVDHGEASGGSPDGHVSEERKEYAGISIGRKRGNPLRTCLCKTVSCTEGSFKGGRAERSTSIEGLEEFQGEITKE